MLLLLYLPLIVWMGLSEIARDEMRDPVKVKTSRRPGNDRPRKILDFGGLCELSFHVGLLCECLTRIIALGRAKRI